MSRKEVLDFLLITDAPKHTDSSSNSTSFLIIPLSYVEAIDDTFKELLKSLRHFDTLQPKKSRSKVKLIPRVLKSRFRKTQVMTEKRIRIRSSYARPNRPDLTKLGPIKTTLSIKGQRLMKEILPSDH